MDPDLWDWLFLAGAVLVAGGFLWLFPPLALLWAGGVLMAVAIYGARCGAPDPSLRDTRDNRGP